MLKNIVIEGFRGFSHLELTDFKQFNLFVGKNNYGKTTILESIFLLIGASNPTLPIVTNSNRDLKTIDKNTWSLFFNNLNMDSNIRITGFVNDLDQKRELVIKPSTEIDESTQITIDNAKMTSDSKEGRSFSLPSINGLMLEYSLIKSKKRKGERNETVVTHVYASNSGLKYKFDKAYKEHMTGIYLDQNKQDTIANFNEIQIKKLTQDIVRILRLIEPSLNSISLGAGGLIYCDIGLDKLVPINILGSGIFKIMSILLAIIAYPNGIVMIDEIENGLYPSSQEILWHAIFEAAKKHNVQIFATTHSIECIRAFSSTYSDYNLAQNDDNIRLFRIERKNDIYKIVSYNYRILAASLESGWEVR
jgi:AAA15 family ATPase/GTPase